MCYYVQKLHWFCTSIFTDYSLWLRNEIKHELSLLNSQQRTPNKRLHCIAELRARAQSLGIADFCRFSSGCSILIKSSEQWPNFSAATSWVGSQFLQQFLFLVLRWRLEKLFASKILPPKKKVLGGTPSFSNFYVSVKKSPTVLVSWSDLHEFIPCFRKMGTKSSVFRGYLRVECFGCFFLVQL